MPTLHSATKHLVAGLLASFALTAFAGNLTGENPRESEGNMLLPAPVQVPAGKTVENVKGAIFNSLPLRGWTGKEIAPGVIEANFDKKGKHSLTVDLKYDTKAVTFVYKNSVNLRYEVVYDQPKLHYKANSWMKNLAQDISNTLNR